MSAVDDLGNVIQDYANRLTEFRDSLHDDPRTSGWTERLEYARSTTKEADKKLSAAMFQFAAASFEGTQWAYLVPFVRVLATTFGSNPEQQV
jgi:hypothetical protein